MNGSFTFGKVPPSEVPQSFKTVTDSVAFKNPLALKLPTTMVFFMPEGGNPAELIPDNEDSKFRHRVWKRVTSRGWKVEQFKGDHVSEKTHPVELAAFLHGLLRESLTSQ